MQDVKEIRFRDETRTVSDFIFARLMGIQTRLLTYEEAMDQANKREIADHLNGEQQRMIRAHFERKF